MDPQYAATSTDDLPYVLTVKDVARLLRISPKQVRSLPIRRVQGLGPRSIRYRREDVMELLGEKSVGVGQGGAYRRSP